MGQCETITAPSAIVLLGATGDLAQKKLLTSLMDLYTKGVLPKRFHVVAFSKDELTTDTYRSFARAIIEKKGHHYDPAAIETFLESFEYVQGFFDDRAAFERIKDALEAYDTSIGMCASKLFYLAVPPMFYDTIFDQLAATDLEQPCVAGDGWTRILVEKPFGNDLAHAQHLDKKLATLFKEEQIYRIDHYLAKDAIQNILAFRFSNVLFEHNWNHEDIEAVYINVSEKFDVADRGAFFDGVGALRDVGQNHMLQMLALIAMESPEELSSVALRAKRAEVLQALRVPTPETYGTHIVKGQYEGYRTVRDVDPASKTETYFALKTYVDNERWRGVPFYLEHGKAVGGSSTEVTIRFRSSHNCVCGVTGPHDHPNFVRFTISPEQKITLRFWARHPGLQYRLEPHDLVFDRQSLPADMTQRATEAYEEVLFDALCGEQTLFVSSPEQEAQWRYISAILDIWKNAEPERYAPGSVGPSSKLQDEISKLFTT
jgi:glucose-6-phosphate 1-dehydrogenase